MATLVLTAAGSIFGPIGGAVGALIGQSIDQRLLKPKGRQGPRLQDLRVQTSSYGTPIPKLFGTMRVAGTVIWSTDLVERRSRQGGKGRPTTTTYSYSASFAVALSSRPIRSVGRIWADGNLLRGAAGDWKQETGFRLHLGSEDQAVDPFIASAEGIGGTPAYRGCAYAAFENMALEPYGNRIPSLTFEVEADAGPVSLAAMLAELSDAEIEASGSETLGGYAASGESLAGAIADLGSAFRLHLRDAGDRLSVQPATLIASLSSSEIKGGSERRRSGAGEAPTAVTISHYDPARDYQIGVQGGQGGRHKVERIELPAALPAGEASALAEAALERRLRGRARASVQCGWRRLPIGPGALVRLPGEDGLWRVERRTVDREGARLDLVSERLASLAARPADPGRDMPAVDAVHGATTIQLLDLPALDDGLATVPRLLIAAAGQLSGWRRANLLVTLDDGASWQPIGRTAPPAVIGAAETVLPPASPHLIDSASELTVMLTHDGMALEDADDARLLAGANLALLGAELIQFGSAVPLGAGRWRLSRLLRGRRGTEWAIGAHAAGDRFVLIEPDALLSYDAPLSALAGTVRILASGIGDGVPAEAQAAGIGEALRPPSPAHLVAQPRSDGGYDLSWVRRSRLGWAWGEVDAALGEAGEHYRVTFRRADGEERAVETNASALLYEEASAQADQSAGPHVDVTVVQIGASAISRPAQIRIIF
jgi:hypothetical protein